MEEGKKFDQSKAKPTLLIRETPLAFREVSSVLLYGASKYSVGNWRKVPEGWVRYHDAALRHLLAFAAGEERDEESKHHHLAHATCCLLFLVDAVGSSLSFYRRGPADLESLPEGTGSSLMPPLGLMAVAARIDDARPSLARALELTWSSASGTIADGASAAAHVMLLLERELARANPSEE